jgi:hypothetical protein
LIHTNSDGLKLGIWLMPNNVSCGMLEAFLLDLIPEGDPLIGYANKAAKTAQRLGAPFKPAHHQKAIVHTWLAWQDEPGAQLHQAVKKQVLASTGPHAAPFVKWFRELFDV